MPRNGIAGSEGSSYFQFFKDPPYCSLDFPDSSVGKESACNAGDPASIPGSGRSAGEGKIYKQLIQLNTTKINNPIKKWEKDLTDISPKKTYKIGRAHV